MAQAKSRGSARDKVRRRIRSRVQGTAERPRLSVFKSLKHLYAQVIDDKRGVTLVSASSLDEGFTSEQKGGGTVAAAKKVGARRRRASRASCSTAAATRTTGRSKRWRIPPARTVWSFRCLISREIGTAATAATAIRESRRSSSTVSSTSTA
jgi:ribosomal protein L18